MKYDWKLPTVWASQHIPWVFFLLFSLSLSLLDSKFFNQEGNTCLLCIKHSKKHIYFKQTV